MCAQPRHLKIFKTCHFWHLGSSGKQTGSACVVKCPSPLPPCSKNVNLTPRNPETCRLFSICRQKQAEICFQSVGKNNQKHPAGWETARGGSMTSCKYLSTDLNTLTVVYACWENNLGSKSCYLQWGKILSNILVVNAILREGNILLEGLEFDSFFWRICLKPEFRSNFGCHFAALFSQVSFLRRYAIAVFLQRFVAAVFSHRHCQARIYMCMGKVCTEAVHCVALWTRVTLGLDMRKVCTEAVHCVALWTRVTLGLDMCKVCTEAVHCVALWTRVTLGLDMCKVCTEAVHCVALWTRVTLGLDMRKVCTEAVHCVALWTRVTLGLDMRKVCTEAVHCVALWTRVTLGLDMCKVCTEAVHCVALWTRVTLGLDMRKVCTEACPLRRTLNTSYIRFGHA